MQPETGQVVIDARGHPGPDAGDDDELRRAPTRRCSTTLARGQAIDFEVEFTGKAYVVTQATVRESGVATSGGGQLGAASRRVDDPAPPFQLTDQDGNPKSLADWRGASCCSTSSGRAVPGPCPILTGLHVDVQRKLPPALRARTHFVSISLDPVRDTPAVLREYATKRGADLAGWSFLTGAAGRRRRGGQELRRRQRARRRTAQIEHVVVTFLIDGDGQIRRRYLGLDGHEPSELLRDIERLATP